MKLVPVRCQHCGAALEVGEGARYVTCQFCKSQLAVQRTGSAVFTELLGDIADKTERMAENLDAIRIQNEIEKLDREWQMQREGFLIRSENGNTREPSAAGAVFGGAVLILFGILWVSMLSHGSKAGAPSGILTGFSLIGYGIILFGIFMIAKGPHTAAQFTNARDAYEQRRRKLEKELGESASNSRQQGSLPPAYSPP
jgi:hypothetical protein